MTERELYREINFKQNLKTYLKMASKYKWLFVILIFLATAMEFFGVAEKYLFKIILDNGSEYLAGNLARTALVNILIIVAGIFIGFVFLRVLDNWFRIALLNRLDARMIFDMKKRFFNHIVSLDHSFHTTHKTGSLISKLNRGASAIERLTDFFIFNVAPLALQIVLVGGSLILIDWVAAIVIILTAIAFIGFGLYTSEIQKPAHVVANKAEDFEKGRISDIFMNIDSIKYFGKENVIKRKYEAIAEETRTKMLRFWNYGRLFSAGESLILSVGTFFAIYFPLLKFLNNEMTIGTLAFIYTVYGGLIGPLFGFVHGVRGFYISLGDFDALLQYEKVEKEIIDESGAKNLVIKKGTVEFEDVGFAYKGRSNARAIRDFNLKIHENEKVALVGHSGCGKTTLMKLLFRFYDPDRGKILIDGKNIKHFKQESLRGELSIVPQEGILFDDTIYNNIAFSRPGARREDVLRAIKFAQLDKFIATLPKREQTIVGERGVKLSGGEKQRVSIARAILADKKILVLDEATSSLDSQTEFEIQRALEKLMQGRTTIIIAHRLSTIMKADKIVVMEKGKIVQTGNHRELIREQGIYKNLWNLQKGGYI